MHSNGFYITGDTSVYYLDDNGLGKVRFYTLLPSGDKVYNSLYSGSVSYDTGEISLANISISSIVGAGQLGIVVKPLNNDIFPDYPSTFDLENVGIIHHLNRKI